MEENRLGVIKSITENKASMLSNLDEVKLNAEKYIFCVKSDLENQLKDQKVRCYDQFLYISYTSCAVLGSIRVNFAKVLIRLDSCRNRLTRTTIVV